MQLNTSFKILQILDRREKLQTVAVFVLMLLGAAFETVGIGLIPAFVKILSQPEIIQKNHYLLWIYKTTGMDSIQQFLIWTTVSLIAFYALKNIYLCLVNYIQYRFLFEKQVSLSRRLFGSYLDNPYTFHLQINPAKLIFNLNTEVLTMFNNVLMPGITLFTEIMVATLVAVLLIVVEPVASLVAVCVIGTAGFGFYRLIRKRTGALGKVRQYHASKMIQWVNQGLGGIKEVKVLGREGFFVNTFSEHCTGYAHTSMFMQIISALPRLFLESTAVISILIIVLVVLAREIDIQSAVPTLTLFAIAAFRLMPSANRIVASLTSIRYYSHSVDVIHHDLFLGGTNNSDKTSGNKNTSINFHNCIELKNVHYLYPKAKEPSLKGISLSIPKTHSIGFVGSSGAGKTTIVDIILGLLTPTDGEVLVDGENIQDNLDSWRRQIGYIPQNIYLSDDTILSNIAFGLPEKEIDEQKVCSAVEAAQLNEFVDRLPEKLHTIVGDRGIRLSGGERQRIGIARALYHDPEVLIMDEATAALDNETEREFARAIERLSGKKTLIVIAHQLSTLKKCDCLYLVESGEIIGVGTYDELLSKSSEFMTLIGTDYTKY